uniref:c-type cytochrome biogenensis protein n=1 Tax=Glaucosphaera vacuolata TaxID=38265 RepID=UPI001FCDB1A8|nr:c-type cytochrome biogenensis protein [Glaucosphaera vacuolata]UNJ18668.1 c-type cytochrome biogenensis protein [Glaucosphaera vacuolata]
MINLFKKFRWNLLKILSNLKFSIILLLIIAFLSMLGTIIEQEKPLQFYQTQYIQKIPLVNIVAWQVIFVGGFNHIYKTVWFIGLLFCLGCSLISCTFSTQLPLLKVSKKWQFFKKKQYYNFLDCTTKLKTHTISHYLEILSFQNYYIFQQKSSFYAYQGLIGRVAPVIVHLSMIFILIGSILGLNQGFVGQELIPKGEVFHFQNILNTGKMSIISQKFSGKIKDFFITYNENGSISQFFSDVIIVDDSNNVVSQKKIFVNQPLQYQGIYIYQTDWDLLGLRIESNNHSILQIPFKKVNTKAGSIWTASIQDPMDDSKGISFILTDLTKNLFLYNFKGELINNYRIGQPVILFNRCFKVIDIIATTGLQIKTDPGIPIVYLGFFLLMISSTISYCSYSQIWILRTPSINYYGGKTNRALLSFEKEFYKTTQSLEEISE